jgi:uncharacterized membrane protein
LQSRAVQLQVTQGQYYACGFHYKNNTCFSNILFIVCMLLCVVMIFCFSVNTINIHKYSQSVPLVYVGTALK